MSRPFLLAQLSDFHVGADWAGGDPTAGLAAAVGAVRALPERPDAVLVTGDLADHATDSEYEEARELLARIEAPVHVLPGNHDDRDALARWFGVPGARGEPVQYAVDIGPLRLVVLDTTIPGEDPGSLAGGRLDWLDAELAAEPERPTLVAMHHPPLVTGVPGWDGDGLARAHQDALAAVVGRHPQVQRLVAGHVHAVLSGELAGRPVLTAPSTYVQARARISTGEIDLVHEPAGFVLHALRDGELVSQVESVAPGR